MDGWKGRWKDSEKRKEEERRSEKNREEKERERERESQKKEDAGARCVFPMFCGSGGSKSRLAKAAGAEPSCQMRDEQ